MNSRVSRKKAKSIVESYGWKYYHEKGYTLITKMARGVHKTRVFTGRQQNYDVIRYVMFLDEPTTMKRYATKEQILFVEARDRYPDTKKYGVYVAEKDAPSYHLIGDGKRHKVVACIGKCYRAHKFFPFFVCVYER